MGFLTTNRMNPCEQKQSWKNHDRPQNIATSYVYLVGL